ncbi:hypothetical protein N658DRAFT_498605 [Parathielavia hyrcaniae]|uniref:Uncharacterized protein n=1 Tax=Parathielavia hyrcaniae TaxID=113614 RepID=A0AAN6T052_9PEZI|nr:hypothetical protein N658DRAFT_498605 [Parathielavia hyrcaniae]
MDPSMLEMRLDNIRLLHGFKEHLREKTGRRASSLKRSEPALNRQYLYLALLFCPMVHCPGLLLDLPALAVDKGCWGTVGRYDGQCH